MRWISMSNRWFWWFRTLYVHMVMRASLRWTLTRTSPIKRLRVSKSRKITCSVELKGSLKTLRGPQWHVHENQVRFPLVSKVTLLATALKAILSAWIWSSLRQVKLKHHRTFTSSRRRTQFICRLNKALYINFAKSIVRITTRAQKPSFRSKSSRTLCQKEQQYT